MLYKYAGYYYYINAQECEFSLNIFMEMDLGGKLIKINNLSDEIRMTKIKNFNVEEVADSETNKELIKIINNITKEKPSEESSLFLVNNQLSISLTF